MKKKLCFSLLLTFLLTLVMAVPAFAETDISEDYRILLSSPGYSYNENGVEAPFYVVSKNLESYYMYEDFDAGRVSKDDYVLPESNYDFTYANNKERGTATLTVTGKGEFTGTLTADYEISYALMKLTKTINADTSVTLTPDISLKQSDIKSVEVITIDEYKLSKGSEYTVSKDGAVTLKRAFLRGETGFKATDNNIRIRVMATNHYGDIKVKGYNVSHLSQWNNGPFVYNGKNHTPKVTVDGVKRGTDYKVTYDKKTRKEIGPYYYTIKGIGKCTGKLRGYFEILPKKTTSVSAKRTKSKATIKWKKVANCSGYEVQLIRYCTEESDMISYDVYKRAFVKNKNTLSKTFSSVKKSKYSKARVRAYKTVKGKKYYSKWKYKSF